MRLALVAAVLAGFALPAISQTATPPSLITMIRTGWDAESFAVVTQGPILNPQHCPIADGYVTDSSAPGYNTYYAAALAAYVSNTPVSVVVFDRAIISPAGTRTTTARTRAGTNVASPCDQGRPKLIGINLTRSGH
jgi:hypothetical protein